MKQSFHDFRAELASYAKLAVRSEAQPHSAASIAPQPLDMSAAVLAGLGQPGAPVGECEYPGCPTLPNLCEGGLLSISPPSNVRKLPRVLACGIDTLVVAFDITWADGLLFRTLAGLKATAKELGADEQHRVPLDDVDTITLGVHGTGIRGFEWVLSGNEYMFQLANAMTPTTRPSMMVEVRSECLWRYGPGKAIDRVLQWIACKGGIVTSCKVSRVDLCVDLMVSADVWVPGLYQHAVTYSTDNAVHYHGVDLQGISFGGGKSIVGRIYDKWAELQNSGKYWFMDVWRVNGPDEGCKIIRAEFQLRREQIKEFGVDQWTDLASRLPAIWGYLSGSWLQFVEDRDKHTARQTVSDWWGVVRLGFTGAQIGREAVRVRACRAQKKQMIAQMFGLATAVAALDYQGDAPTYWNVGEYLKKCGGYAADYKLGATAFKTKFEEKESKYRRGRIEDLAEVEAYHPEFTWGPSGVEQLIYWPS